ncbi:MAG: phosphatase PAP2 family protein [Bacteroidota bacterium]
MLIASCQKKELVPIADHELATAWADMTLYITKHTPANSPTFASRCLGYIGLTMYECVVHGDTQYHSLVGQLNELNALPKPDASETYDWRIALNAGQASILKNIYIQTADSNKVRIDSLERAILDRLLLEEQTEALTKRSIAYGQAVAERIFEWSKSDGGHRGYLRNFDKSLTFPNLPGGWKPPLYAQSFSHHPLHPHWGKNRTFLSANALLSTPEMIPFDTAASSAYYQQHLAVYEKEKILTQAEKEAAIWWSDDPDETFSPGGHSYYIANGVVKAKQPELIKSAATFARVGISIADAFILCWKWKYYFFSERPNTFVPKFIDETWESFWPDPPFPAFPSGHAVQAGAAAQVLIGLYGNSFQFTDNAHLGRERDELRETDFIPRQFNSFWEVAEETAESRFYGGIHTEQDNNRGLEKGKAIGENVNQLNWNS